MMCRNVQLREEAVTVFQDLTVRLQVEIFCYIFTFIQGPIPEEWEVQYTLDRLPAHYWVKIQTTIHT